MKKIVFLVPIYAPAKISGSEVYVKSIAEELAHRGVSVSVITSNALDPKYWYNPFSRKIKKEMEYINGVLVRRLRVSHFRSTILFITSKIASKIIPRRVLDYASMMSFGPILKNLAKTIGEEDPDVIHCSPIPTSVCLQLYKNRKFINKRTRIICTPFLHPDIGIYDNGLISKVFDYCDIIHTVTGTEKKYMIEKYHVRPDKIITIPLFISKNRLNVSKVDQKYKNIFKHSNRNVLFAGNKGRYKGALMVYEAVKLLSAKYSNLRFVAIGNSTPEWKKKINKNDQFLVDVGYVSINNKEYFFSKTDLFCMPSISDSFGLVYLEAWKYKKPVIAADNKVMKSVLGSGASYVEYGNVDALSKLIERYLYKNSNDCRTIGNNGFVRLNRLYNKKTILNKYFKMFEI